MSLHEFVHAFTDDQFKGNFGLDASVFVIVYDKYCGRNTLINTPEKLASLFKYYKLYPVVRGFEVEQSNVDHTSLRKYERHLASVIDELDTTWNDR